MNLDARDLSGVAQPDVLPGLAGIARLVEPDARRDVAGRARAAGAAVDDVRVRLGDRDRADRRGFEVAVRDVRPRRARVDGTPDASAGAAHVVQLLIAGDAGDGRY